MDPRTFLSRVAVPRTPKILALPRKGGKREDLNLKGNSTGNVNIQGKEFEEVMKMDNTNGNKKGEDDNRSIVLTIPFTVVGAYPGPGGQYLYLT